MKKLAVLFILFSSVCFSQKAEYNKLKEENNYSEYFSKNKKLIKIGDTINIKYPRAGNTFTFITQGNSPTGSILSNTKIVITKIKSIGSNKRGYKIYFLFKGYGLIPVYIEYESALETGEIE
jgi:hypothetical protein